MKKLNFIGMTGITVLTLAVLLGACAKSEKKPLAGGNGTPPEVTKPLAPVKAGPTRATWLKNVPIRVDLATAIEASGIKGGLCIQHIMPSGSEDNAAKTLEVSQGPCPANNALVDDKKSKVFQLNYVPVGPSNQYEMQDNEYKERAGLAEWSSIADKNNRTVVQINTLCNHADDLCYIRVEGDKFDGIEMY